MADDLENILGIESSGEVICELYRAAYPLSVELAPAELCPAGIGNGHMELVLLHLMPVFGCYDVSERMCEIVTYHFGHTC